MKISGTFLADSYTDIPDLNYGPAEWDREFAVMKAFGIDTVILQRCGIEDYSGGFGWAVYHSEVLPLVFNEIYEDQRDMIALFLRLAEKYEMSFFMGIYRFFRFHGDPECKELIYYGKKIIDELWSKYGSSPAFKGWYLPHEIARNWQPLTHFQELGKHCKNVSNGLPVMISPGNHGIKNVPAHESRIRYEESPTTLEQHIADWTEMMPQLVGSIDIIATQDGHVDFHELPAFTAFNRENAQKHGIHFWSNVESFDRDKPIKFLPISFQKLLLKQDIAEKAGAEKCITYEFPHFMSPYSCWPQAANLYQRYCEKFGIEAKKKNLRPLTNRREVALTV